MTTCCESGFLKVGDKIKFLGPDDHTLFKVGDILTLVENDESSAPYFRNRDGEYAYFCLLTRTWTRFDDHQGVKSCDKQPYDKEEILDYLVENLTIKELLTYLNEHCTVTVNK